MVKTMYLLRIQSIVGYTTLKMEVLSCRRERQPVAVKPKKNDVSGCLHLLTPRFPITAIPKSKTVDSEYMIKFFQDTMNRLTNLRKNPAIYFDDMQCTLGAKPSVGVWGAKPPENFQDFMLILDPESTCKWHCNKKSNSHSGCKNEKHADFEDKLENRIPDT